MMSWRTGGPQWIFLVFARHVHGLSQATQGSRSSAAPGTRMTAAVSLCRRGMASSACGSFVVAIGLLFTAVPAQANVSHVFANAFGTAGSTPANPYPLLNPTDVEVDQTSHDIYVTDPGNHRVEEFNEKGEFLLMFGKDVNKTTKGNVCPENPGDTCQPGTAISSPGGLEDPTYLAVDNSGGASDGDIYVADTGDNRVSKFDASGHLLANFGTNGQLDIEFRGQLWGVAVGPDGDLYTGSAAFNGITGYTPDGDEEVYYSNASRTPWLKVDVDGNIYYGEPLAVDPSDGELYQNNGFIIEHYSVDCNPWLNGPCEPVDSFGKGHLFGAMGIAIDGSSHTVYVVNSTSNDIAVFSDVRPVVTTSFASNVTESTVTLNGRVDPDGRGNITECRFEYGFGKTYGHSIPCTPDPESSPFTEATNVTAVVSGLSPGTRDHYRVVATNASGATSDGNDETFITTQPPSIDGLKAEKLTVTTAELIAELNPNGLQTSYWFEYGPNTSYGETVPIPDGMITGSSVQERRVQLSGLTPHVVYHYRLVAENEDGSTTSEDHTFNFYPQSCPNEIARQQTDAGYLPDCRAYELVSPGNAGSTALYPGGPNTGYATNPPRFSFAGTSGTLPEAGGDPIDANGDLYVATRTDTGWISRYVGLASDEAALDGGPPQGPPGSGFPEESVEDCSQPGGDCGPTKLLNNVLTDPEMDSFAVWDDGNPAVGNNAEGDLQNEATVSSNAPYVYGSEGRFRERWPTDLGAISPAPHALDCSKLFGEFFGGQAYNICPGDVTASADLSHFVFATETHLFAPEGRLSAPGLCV